MQRRRRQLVVGAVSALAAPALFFGKSYAATPRAVLRTAWWSDPFVRGSYSHLGLHGTRADRAQLAQPVTERLVFAGEATEPDYPSTVHGAILSGRRAADQIRDLGVGHVAIIGAGVAGLAAAELLLRDGIAVDLLEARAHWRAGDNGSQSWLWCRSWGVMDTRQPCQSSDGDCARAWPDPIAQ